MRLESDLSPDLVPDLAPDPLPDLVHDMAPHFVPDVVPVGCQSDLVPGLLPVFVSNLLRAWHGLRRRCVAVFCIRLFIRIGTRFIV